METQEKKILIIEDERPISRALELKLTRAGFNAKTAADGEEGIHYLEKEKVDIILLDLVMPKKDGFAVLATLKERGIKTPVLVLSNLGQQEDFDRAKALGAKEFFIKSNTPIADIVHHIENILG